MKKEILKKLAKPLLYPLAIGIVLWEQLAYKPIKAITNYLERNKVFHKVSDKIRNSNPYIALAILACGGLPLIPFKMAGLYLVGHGYTFLGIGTFGLAKVIGGAISVHLFNLTEPAIRKIGWANTSLDWVFDKKDKVKKILTESKAYITTKQTIDHIKSSIKEVLEANSYYQKIKMVWNKNIAKKPEDNFIIHELIERQTNKVKETTFFEQITTKVEIMNYTVDNFISDPKPTEISINESVKINALNENEKPVEIIKVETVSIKRKM